MDNHVTIDDITFAAAEVPPSAAGRPPSRMAQMAMDALDRLGVDSVQVGDRVNTGNASHWTAQARRNGLPVRFVTRKVGEARQVFAVRIKGGES